MDFELFMFSSAFSISGAGFIFLCVRTYEHHTEMKLFKVASPCSQYWGNLEGNERKRFCSLCNKHVINVCRTPKAERADLLRKADRGESVCIYLEPNAWRKVLNFTHVFLFSMLSLVVGVKFKNAISQKLFGTGTSDGVLMGTILTENNFQKFGQQLPVQSKISSPGESTR